MGKYSAIEARFDVVLQVLARQLSIEEAVANGTAKVKGSPHTLRKLPMLFELATAKH